MQQIEAPVGDHKPLSPATPGFAPGRQLRPGDNFLAEIHHRILSKVLRYWQETPRAAQPGRAGNSKPETLTWPSQRQNDFTGEAGKWRQKDEFSFFCLHLFPGFLKIEAILDAVEAGRSETNPKNPTLSLRN
jgi:hypothetical protein